MGDKQKIFDIVGAMNDKQKIFVIVGAMTFGFWLIYPMSFSRYFFLLDIIFDFEDWFREGIIQVIPFVVSIGCVVGFFLFKDK